MSRKQVTSPDRTELKERLVSKSPTSDTELAQCNASHVVVTPSQCSFRVVRPGRGVIGCIKRVFLVAHLAQLLPRATGSHLRPSLIFREATS